MIVGKNITNREGWNDAIAAARGKGTVLYIGTSHGKACPMKLTNGIARCSCSPTRTLRDVRRDGEVVAQWKNGPPYDAEADTASAQVSRGAR